VKRSSSRGRVYRCPICGAELAVVAAGTGEFRPRCCDTDMVRLARGLAFYVCPICGAELAVMRKGGGMFAPRCCDTAMLPAAA